MIYDIQQKKDVTGTSLAIQFPADDIDVKALMTIRNDCPPFIVPFDFRIIDNEAECIYHLSAYSKLLYRFGEHTPTEFLDFWRLLLNPVLNCGDWFMKPESFVMDEHYLYSNRNGDTFCYLYVPSSRNCEEDGAALERLAMKLLIKNPVTNKEIHNKALLSAAEQFQPERFLSELQEAVSRASVQIEKVERSTAPAPEYQSAQTPVQEMPSRKLFGKQSELRQEPLSQPMQQRQMPASPTQGLPDEEIYINLSGNNPVKENKKEKKDKKEKEKSGLFGGLFKKKAQQKDIRAGAAETNPPAPAERASDPWPQQYRQGSAPQYGSATELDEPGAYGAVTELEADCPFLRRIGNMNLPEEIRVDIAPGTSFTIGRFDVEYGRKQSDFEFAATEKAISRRHAAIERKEDGGYVLVDIGSRFGTFLNGERLPINMERAISSGCHISFGPKGADYIWEEWDEA